MPGHVAVNIANLSANILFHQEPKASMRIILILMGSFFAIQLAAETWIVHGEFPARTPYGS